MRVLVTGASGFLGRAILDDLDRAGHDVVAVVHSSHVDASDVETVDCDVRDPDQVRAAVEGMDAVVHSAALVGAGHGIAELRSVNVDGTRNVMDACLEFGVEHVVHISSTCVMDEYIDHYGSDESHPYPTRGRDGYTRTKVEAERVALGRAGDMTVTVVRPGWVWGPGSPGTRRLLRALDRDPLALPGSGGNIVHLVYRDNVAAAVGRIVDLSAPGKFIITDGAGTSLGTFIGRLREHLGRDPLVRGLPFGLVDALSSVTGPLGRAMGIGLPDRLQVSNLGRHHDFDNRRSRVVLGYEPEIGLEEGVTRTVRWYRGACP